jgi:hypothetical protein
LKHWIDCYDNQVVHWLIDELMQVLDTNMPWGFCGWRNFYLIYIWNPWWGWGSCRYTLL